jgi:hypothetical protein
MDDLLLKNTHLVLPVIHVVDAAQALRNAAIARQAGADGIFLINHGISSDELFAIHRRVLMEHPSYWWIGLNCLDLAPDEVFRRLPAGVDGVWVDDAKIREDQEAQPDAERIGRAQRGAPGRPLLFGGVAFKYQRPVAELEAAARIAARHMDIVTTSGPGTGHAADLDKLRRMRSALPWTPLAVASGITPENVCDYLPLVDCFLVATGISSSFEELDRDKVHALVARVRAFSGPAPRTAGLTSAARWGEADDLFPTTWAQSQRAHGPLAAASFRELAARPSIWTVEASITLRLWDDYLPIDFDWALPRGSDFAIAMETSSRPVEENFVSCLHLVRHPAGTASAGAAVRAFVRAQLDAHPNPEQQLRERYGKLPAHAVPRFNQMDYPVFDNGSLALGFGLYVQRAERYQGEDHVWCWSRYVHHHK